MEGGHLAALGPERKGGGRSQERRRLCQRPDDADPAPRRHRPGAFRQDRVHHRPGAQPGVGRAPALFRGHGRGAHHPRLSRAAARRHPAALCLRGASGRAGRRPAAMAREHAAHQPAARHRRVQRRTRCVKRTLGTGRLHIDIVDYPGEWLLDLPLLEIDFAEWSAQALAEAQVARVAQMRRAPGSSFLADPRSDGAGRRAEGADRRPALHSAICSRRAHPMPC